MKLLIVTAGQLELARAKLQQPFLTVGRSPSCDVLLRAPGVEAIHFLIEWIGTGEFDPNLGMWSITDISKSAEATATEEGETGEGIVFSEHPVNAGGFTFACIEDRLEATDTIGGGIAENIRNRIVAKSEILELIQVRTDSGAIEEVKHVRVHHGKRKERLLPLVKEFKIEWQGGKGAQTLLNILLEEMPGAEIFNRGQRVQSKNVFEVKPHDLLRIRWKSRDFFIRLVDEVKSPPIPRDVMGDPLLRKLLMSVGVLGLLLVMMIRFLPPSEKKGETPPIRVARVEVPRPQEPPKPVEEPPKPQETPEPQVTPQPIETKPPPEPKPKPKPTQQSLEKPPEKKPERVKKPKDAITAPGKGGGQAAAPRVTTDRKSEVRAGLNSPAKVSDINAVGILGALKKIGPKGKGVQADRIVNDAIVTEAVSGAGASKVVLKNPPAGTLGAGSSGSPKGKGSELGAASTTLSGVGEYDPESVGPIAVKGGVSGLQIGSNTKGTGTGGSSSPSLGGVDTADFTVEGGGLDRETVRRVIGSYKGQIRTCYERALLTQTNLEGRIVYDWRISANGPVVTARIVKSTVASSNLAACVLDIIKQMSFPKAASGRSTRVIYPFVFQGRK